MRKSFGLAEEVKEKLLEDAKTRKESGDLDIPSFHGDAAGKGSGGDISTGYGLLNGSKTYGDRGRFKGQYIGDTKIEGTAEYKKTPAGCTIQYAITVTFNDVTNPNPKAGDDFWTGLLATGRFIYNWSAWIPGAIPNIVLFRAPEPKDFIIHVKWTGKSTVTIPSDGGEPTGTGYPFDLSDKP